MPLVSVIIVNYNAGKHLHRCLQALLTQSFQDFEVLLVDNASTDQSLESLPPSNKVSVIKLEKNVGFAAANNLAAKRAQGTWLALLNPDAFPEKNWLEMMMRAIGNYPQFSMFGSTQICANQPDLIDGSGDLYHILGIPMRGNYRRSTRALPQTGEVFAPCAAAALYKTEDFLTVGGFDEQFFCYCEDVDLAFRLRLEGKRCLQVKEAVVHHIGSAITKKSGSFSRYYGIRNRFLVFIKNMPMPLLIPLLPLHLMFQCVYGGKSLLKGEFKTFCDAWKDIVNILPSTWESRQAVQSRRSIPLFTLVQSFTFSPVKLVLRLSDVRAVKP